ncbi:MAG: amidohydrolase family protein, partial [Lachnospiraceae bacterium]|nr:amidohydrolase family protein [Lachnospiraceae bacterium]
MYDIIIKNGTIVDGTRKKPYAGSVCIKDGKIVKVTAGDTAGEEAKTVIDAMGHIVAPGFVDVHTHSDKSYLACPTHESKLRSGITFELCGQCGLSCIPVSEKNITSQASLGGLLVGESDRYTYKPRDMKT